jgi:ABC-2 type transport system permease protein
MWFLAVGVVGPLMTLMAVSVATMISSRVSDPRVAEQLSMVVILPIIVGVIGQSLGVILIDRQFIIIVGLVVLLVDAVLLYLLDKAFQRETILTRWK